MDQTFKRLFINDNGPKQFFILSLLALAGAVGVHWAVGGGGEMKSLLCFGKARKRQAIEGTYTFIAAKALLSSMHQNVLF